MIDSLTLNNLGRQAHLVDLVGPDDRVGMTHCGGRGFNSRNFLMAADFYQGGAKVPISHARSAFLRKRHRVWCITHTEKPRNATDLIVAAQV